MDGNGLNFEKIGQFFQVLILRIPKIFKKSIMVDKIILYIRRNFTEAF